MYRISWVLEVNDKRIYNRKYCTTEEKAVEIQGDVLSSAAFLGIANYLVYSHIAQEDSE